MTVAADQKKKTTTQPPISRRMRLTTRRTRKSARDRRAGMAFVAPGAIFMGLLIAYPLGYGLYISFFNTNLINRWDFIGLANYEAAVTSGAFLRSIGITAIYTGLVVLGTHVVGLGLALLLNRQGRAFSVFRVLLILPWLFPEVVVALLWSWILNPVYGILNHILMSLNIVSQPLVWLEESRLALMGVVGASVWTSFPLVMVLLLAGLQSIPAELYEAASIDGAGRITSFIHITLPGLAPVLVVTLILQTVWSFKHFTIVWLMTAGGPVNATNVVSISIYREAFQYFNFGQSAAYATIVFILCIIFAGFYWRFVRDGK